MTERADIAEVFTPRNADVNRYIYVKRADLEKQLTRALKGSLHIVIYGESGNGKSWLYKKVTEDIKAFVRVVNCANASRGGSITQEIYKAIIPSGTSVQKGYSETKKAELFTGVLKGNLEHEKDFLLTQEDPLLAAYKFLRKEAIGELAIIVLENLEAIFNNIELMTELGNLIILLDDARYSSCKVKFIIVGVPSDVSRYFANTQNLSTVANRLQEISEVRALSKPQVDELVKKGFVDLLKLDIKPEILTYWQDHIYIVTMGVAQRVHEYCEQLAYIVEDNNWRASIRHLGMADKNWLEGGLREAYFVVENLMNERETKVGRRNQVLYVLQKVEKRDFTWSEIENLVRIEFPESTINKTTLGVMAILSDLAGRPNSIIRKTPKGNAYEFTDPRYLMCLRVSLRKDEERVMKVEISR